jgi:hypothetical protein
MAKSCLHFLATCGLSVKSLSLQLHVFRAPDFSHQWLAALSAPAFSGKKPRCFDALENKMRTPWCGYSSAETFWELSVVAKSGASLGWG